MHVLAFEDAHAALVEQAIEQALAGDGGIDQLVILDGLDQRLGLDPGIVLGRRCEIVRGWPSGMSPGCEIGLPQALRRERQELDHQAAGAIGVAAVLELLGHGEAHLRRDLLGLAEILMRRFLEALAFQRDDALIAAAVGALVDGHGEIAGAEKLARSR